MAADPSVVKSVELTLGPGYQRKVPLYEGKLIIKTSVLAFEIVIPDIADSAGYDLRNPLFLNFILPFLIEAFNCNFQVTLQIVNVKLGPIFKIVDGDSFSVFVWGGAVALEELPDAVDRIFCEYIFRRFAGGKQSQHFVFQICLQLKILVNVKILQPFSQIFLNLFEDLLFQLQISSHHLFDLISPLTYDLIHEKSSIEHGRVIDGIDSIRF